MSERSAGWAVTPIFVGVLLMAIAVSGLLDDTGALVHPWWVVPAASVLAVCGAVAIRTLRRLFGPVGSEVMESEPVGSEADV